MSSQGGEHDTLQIRTEQQGADDQLNRQSQQSAARSAVLHSKCSFHELRGVIDDIVVLRVFVYLDADDLISMGSVSRYFARLTMAPVLWNALLGRDFEKIHKPALNSTSSPIMEPNAPTAKSAYASRRTEFVHRTKLAQEWDVEAQAEAVHSAQVRKLEDVFDLLQVRVIIPLLLACVILTIALFCQKVDGLDISMWACFIPLFAALLYIILSFRLLQVVHKHQFSAEQLLRGMWNNFRGPVVFVYQEVLSGQMRLVYAVFAFLLVCIVQVLLVATKLSASTPSHLRDHYLPWAVVFIPVWLMMVAYCALPVFVRDIDPGVFLSFLCLFFVPLLIFFACLAAKMTGVQHHTKHRKIRLALMLIPFWILEAAALLGSLLFFLAGVGRYVMPALSREVIDLYHSSESLHQVPEGSGETARVPGGVSAHLGHAGPLCDLPVSSVRER